MWAWGVLGEDLPLQVPEVKCGERQANPAAAGARANQGRAQAPRGGREVGREPPEGLYSVPRPSLSEVLGAGVAPEGTQPFPCTVAGVLVTVLGQVEAN